MSNERLIGERWMGKDLERRGLDLTEGTIPEFDWRDWGKSRKTQDNPSPDRDLNTGPPEYETAVLTTEPRHSILLVFETWTHVILLLLLP
jgi:hypothetical protein